MVCRVRPKMIRYRIAYQDEDEIVVERLADNGQRYTIWPAIEFPLFFEKAGRGTYRKIFEK